MVKEMCEFMGCVIMVIDFCCLNMEVSDNFLSGFGQKRTRIHTNSRRLAIFVKAQRNGQHLHILLTNHRATQCQDYTPEFANQGCEAIKDELVHGS